MEGLSFNEISIKLENQEKLSKLKNVYYLKEKMNEALVYNVIIENVDSY